MDRSTQHVREVQLWVWLARETEIEAWVTSALEASDTHSGGTGAECGAELLMSCSQGVSNGGEGEIIVRIWRGEALVRYWRGWSTDEVLKMKHWRAIEKTEVLRYWEESISEVLVIVRY